MKQADNSFCRWDAGQKLLMSFIHQLTFDIDYTIPDELTNAINDMLNSGGDRAFIAEQLSLPSFDEAASLMVDIDPIALTNAIAVLSIFIAQGTQQQLLVSYKACQQDSSKENAVANRALKKCLFGLFKFVTRVSVLGYTTIPGRYE